MPAMVQREKRTFSASMRHKRVIVTSVKRDGNAVCGHIRRQFVQECHRP